MVLCSVFIQPWQKVVRKENMATTWLSYSEITPGKGIDHFCDCSLQTTQGSNRSVSSRTGSR